MSELEEYRDWLLQELKETLKLIEKQETPCG